MLERGEERLYENLGVARGEQPVATQVERPPVGTIRPERRPLVVLPRRGKDGQAARALPFGLADRKLSGLPVPLVRAAPPARRVAGRGVRPPADGRLRASRARPVLRGVFPEDRPAESDAGVAFAGEGSHVRRARRAGSRPAGAFAPRTTGWFPARSWRRARWTLSRRTGALSGLRGAAPAGLSSPLPGIRGGDEGERRVRGRAAGRPHRPHRRRRRGAGGGHRLQRLALRGLRALRHGGEAARQGADRSSTRRWSSACWGSTWWAPCT